METSQVIVKNLPEKISDADLRKHFDKVGTVTSIKLKYKNEIFRRFAFVGFKSPGEAQEACRKLNNTYMKLYKLQVELSREKSDIHKNDLNINEVASLPVSEESDNRVKDPDCSLPVNADGKQNLTILNNEVSLPLSPGNPDRLPEGKAKDLKNWKQFYTVKIKTKEQNASKEKKGKTLTKQNIKLFLKPLKYKSLRIPRDIPYVAYIGFETEKQMNQILLKDRSFLDGVRVRVFKYEKNEKCQYANRQMKDTPWSAAEEKLRTLAEPVASSGKLFVRNLYYQTTTQDLEELFGKIGPIAEISLPICRHTGKVKGYCHVSFVLPEHAARAVEELDGKIFQGRLLHILPSLKQDDETLDKSNIKERKKKDLKNAWHNWNSLFLGSGAVANILSEKLNVSKREILTNSDSRNRSAAVTLALGEVQIVEENKKFLENEGVSLESFSDPGMQRSSTIILAKNLTPHTTARELVDFFSKHGELGRVLLPPSGVTGIIEFINSSEANIAFKNLSYRRFKDLPLYLEWAPIQTFKTEYYKNDKKIDSEPPKSASQPVSSSFGSPEANTTLYVKNLSFETNEEALKTHFSKIGPVCAVCIALKHYLSQGYGFVQYLKTNDAKKAVKHLQNSNLDGHELFVKFSEKTLMPVSQHIKDRSSSSKKLVPVILVKNLPFESPLSEVQELFTPFGEISSIRLPNHRESEHHRGFCFVEFSHSESAQNAFAALSPSTHLRGRRLVLLWAEDDESVENLRKRTAKHFLDRGNFKQSRKGNITESADVKSE